MYPLVKKMIEIICVWGAWVEIWISIVVLIWEEVIYFPVIVSSHKLDYLSIVKILCMGVCMGRVMGIVSLLPHF